MNANDQFYARDAHVDDAAVAPLPASRKIHVQGSRPDLRVPMREISQADTPASFGAEKNPSIVVYDTSGPYTDPGATIASGVFGVGVAMSLTWYWLRHTGRVEAKPDFARRAVSVDAGIVQDAELLVS